MELARIALEGEVIDETEQEVTEQDRQDAFLLDHAAACGDYWCGRGISPCITLVPNQGGPWGG